MVVTVPDPVGVSHPVPPEPLKIYPLVPQAAVVIVVPHALLPLYSGIPAPPDGQVMLPVPPTMVVQVPAFDQYTVPGVVV